MMELNNLLKSLDIDKDYHDKIFGNMIFENLYTKVDLNKYAAIKNKIYWMSLLIYRISMTNYLKSINKNIDFENKSINIEKNNLIVFHLSLNITSEICKQFSNGEIYPSYISMLCRQIIEQICFIKEVKNKYGKLVEYKIIKNNSKRNIVEMVFTRKDGTYSGTDIIRYPFRIIHHELGIQCRFYDLRGNFATICLRNGCEIKDIAEILGHKRIETTQKYYILSLKENKKKVTKVFEENISLNDV